MWWRIQRIWNACAGLEHGHVRICPPLGRALLRSCWIAPSTWRPESRWTRRWVNYYCEPTQRGERLTLDQVLLESGQIISREYFRDKIVVVGSAARQWWFGRSAEAGGIPHAIFVYLPVR
jgi:hypothetical protein